MRPQDPRGDLSCPVEVSDAGERLGHVREDTVFRRASNWKYEYASWHIQTPDHTEDGRIVAGHPRDVIDDSSKFERVASLARPLVEISNEEELLAQIIAPLLMELKNAG